MVQERTQEEKVGFKQETEDGADFQAPRNRICLVAIFEYNVMRYVTIYSFFGNTRPASLGVCLMRSSYKKKTHGFNCLLI